ncbi:hypothetical protein ACP70R_026970 [Stipagrostis hirtigluma subsp. patula]
MPRRRRRRCSSPAASPLALEDNDILEDILLRLPPQPSSLTRAASVCDRWRRLVTGPDFLRRLRSIHREPPLLGVFMNYGGYPLFHSVLDPPDAIPPERFLLWRDEGDKWDLFGVRHGRVLIYNYTRHEFIVWDPATGDRRCVAIPQKLRDEKTGVCNGAVLCAGGGQGHVHGRDCHWSPFQVVLIGISSDERRAVACVYSSATGEWGNLSSAEIRYTGYMVSSSTLIGHSLYWFIQEVGILEFDLGRQILAIIESPRDVAGVRSDDIHIILAEDGGVGLAVTTPFIFDMWDRKISPDGICTWVLRKTVKLEEITGLSRDERGRAIIHGYDEDDDAIFLMTDMGCFVVHLQSMQFKNLGKRDFKITFVYQTCAYFPYRSFYSFRFTLDYQMAWNDCIRAFKEKSLILQEALNSANCRISLTTDTLTLNETTGYMCVTCHFIDNDWKVQKRVIKVFVVETPCDGVDIFNAVLKCIQDWNIEEKIFGITLINSAANYTMVDMLKCNLMHKKVLPAAGKLLHNRCAAHVINLIVNDALEFVDPIVGKIRESVKYIQSSQSRMQKFEEIMAISREDWPPFDSPTHWNSTYWLLEMGLEFKRAFNSLALQDANYTYAPSFEEWGRAVVVCRLLKAWYEATEAISWSSSRTSNLYFHAIWRIKLALDEETSEVDNDVRKVINDMKKKFNKYWKKSYISLSIPVVLDPRFKFMFIKFRFEQSYGADAGKWLKRVRKVLTGLFHEYSSQFDDSNVDSTQDGRLGSDQEADMEEDDPFADWYEHLSKNSRVTTELDRYLNDNPIRQSEGFDILKWWMVHSPVYPNLARIARDMLAMRMSTVPSKSAFSTKERTISDYHSRLTTETTEALICLKDWSQASGPHPSMWSITDFRDRDEFPIDSLCLY